mmetsp:Transcript_27845/g.88528  ORF Transcript_27845/g.88528 Transcript_27845/m.88528 type:complete len:212 (+) Transcript_27845:479-1114(+)
MVGGRGNATASRMPSAPKQARLGPEPVGVLAVNPGPWPGRRRCSAQRVRLHDRSSTTSPASPRRLPSFIYHSRATNPNPNPSRWSGPCSNPSCRFREACCLSQPKRSKISSSTPSSSSLLVSGGGRSSATVVRSAVAVWSCARARASKIQTVGVSLFQMKSERASWRSAVCNAFEVGATAHGVRQTVSPSTKKASQRSVATTLYRLGRVIA